MSDAGPRVFELRLELTRDQLQRMRWLPALADFGVGEPITRNLRSIYYDTPDHRLRARGISLRLWSDGQGWSQSVKAGDELRRLASSLVDAEIAADRPSPYPNLIAQRQERRTVGK